MTKKRTIPKRPGGKRSIPKRKRAAKVAPEEKEAVVSESSEELLQQLIDESIPAAITEEVIEANAQLHARGTDEPEHQDGPEFEGFDERAGDAEVEIEDGRPAKVLSSFHEGKLALDTLHDVVAQVYGLSSYVEAHKIVLRLRKDGLIVDNGLRKNSVPIFELAAR